MAYTKVVDGKVPVTLQDLKFDQAPTKGSENAVTSGGVAETVNQQSSNIAPNYVKQTYPANSYVMQDGVLYTNPNAIATAEDWNPAHWTQTTVAAMTAQIAQAQSHYTVTTVSPAYDSTNRRCSVDVAQKQVVHVNITEVISRFNSAVYLNIDDVDDALIFVNKKQASNRQSLNAISFSRPMVLFVEDSIHDVTTSMIDSDIWQRILLTTRIQEDEEDHGGGSYPIVPDSFYDVELLDGVQGIVEDIMIGGVDLSSQSLWLIRIIGNVAIVTSATR